MVAGAGSMIPYEWWLLVQGGGGQNDDNDDDDSVVWRLGLGNLQHFSRGRRGPEADIRGAAFFYRNTWHGNSWTWK